MKLISSSRIIILTSLAMLAFAGNSLLCRVALQQTEIDAVSFTTIRIISGALVLWLIVRLRGEISGKAGNWLSALALFIYAASFSIAYTSLPTAIGALLLFSTVQITMISYGLWKGERLRGWQILGLVITMAGLIALLSPGLIAPSLKGAILMLGAGIAWGIYSLLGKGANHPICVTGGNFRRAVPLVILLSLLNRSNLSWDSAGIWCAVLSGAIASAGGYMLWYSVLPQLRAMQASIIQLSTPVIAAVGAVILLNEPITLRLGLSSIAVLGGIALVIYPKRGAKNSITPTKTFKRCLE